MRIYITAHAVARYIERVKPHLDEIAAQQEIERLVEGCRASGGIGATPPLWLAMDDWTDGTTLYAEPCPGIAFSLQPRSARGDVLRVTTCMTHDAQYHRLTTMERQDRRRVKRKVRRQQSGRGPLSTRPASPPPSFDYDA